MWLVGGLRVSLSIAETKRPTADWGVQLVLQVAEWMLIGPCHYPMEHCRFEPV